MQAAQTPPRRRGGRVRLHGRSHHGRRRARATGRRNRRRVRYSPASQPALEEETALVLEGSVNIRDLESQYGLVLPHDGGFETLAGFVLARLQKIPATGDGFEFEGRRYTVEEMEGHRIAKVKIETLEPAPLQQAGD